MNLFRNKYLGKSGVKDGLYNILAFGIYIGMTQIVIMPFIARISKSDENFSAIIIFITIFNMLCIAVGDELGNTRMVLYTKYKEKKLSGDFHPALALLLISFAVILLVTGLIVDIPPSDIATYCFIGALGITRYFAMSSFRLERRFFHIFIVSLAYCIGSLPGIWAALRYGFFLAPFASGEAAAVLAVLYFRLQDKDRLINMTVTEEFRPSVKKYGQLGTVSLMTNLIIYLDRLIIYPLLGAAPMAVYYSASAMSKILGMINNPVASYALSVISKKDDSSGPKITGMLFRLIFPLLAVTAAFSAVLTYAAVLLLYPQYFDSAIVLIIPVSLASALSIVSYLVRTVIIRFYSIRKFLYANVVYVIVFLISILIFSYLWGITGFAWAVCLSRGVQFAVYLRLMKPGTTK
ncbi:MAG TPA: hypothetical protein PLK90_11440 [Clostridiales bacterium]|nr:hypothetical protein [Clostridiales bacterium]HQP71003.1 hypothetical protein [Clostridiales bacterium]